jgi:SAP domain-containing protein
MSGGARFGTVQVRLNDDGSLWVYQPDPSRVLSPGLAGDLIDWLVLNYEPMNTPAVAFDFQSTVGGGVIGTSDGPVDPGLTDTEQVASGDSSDAQGSDGLTATELEADRNAAEARAEIVEKALAPKFDESTGIQDLRKAAKERGLSAKGSKADLLKRLAGNE